MSNAVETTVTADFAPGDDEVCKIELDDRDKGLQRGALYIPNSVTPIRPEYATGLNKDMTLLKYGVHVVRAYVKGGITPSLTVSPPLTQTPYNDDFLPEDAAKAQRETRWGVRMVNYMVNWVLALHGGPYGRAPYKYEGQQVVWGERRTDTYIEEIQFEVTSQERVTHFYDTNLPSDITIVDQSLFFDASGIQVDAPELKPGGWFKTKGNQEVIGAFFIKYNVSYNRVYVFYEIDRPSVNYFGTGTLQGATSTEVLDEDTIPTSPTFLFHHCGKSNGMTKLVGTMANWAIRFTHSNEYDQADEGLDTPLWDLLVESTVEERVEDPNDPEVFVVFERLRSAAYKEEKTGKTLFLPFEKKN